MGMTPVDPSETDRSHAAAHDARATGKDPSEPLTFKEWLSDAAARVRMAERFGGGCIAELRLTYEHDGEQFVVSIARPPE